MQIEKGIHLFHGDCLEVLKKLPSNSVDMFFFSPPYDELRDYNGFSLNLPNLGKEIERTLKDGGVAAMVIQDSTNDFKKSGTTFRTIVNWLDNTELKLWECCIYNRKATPGAWWTYRFSVDHEYIPIFFKGKRPQHFDKEHMKIVNPNAGKKINGSVRGKDGDLIPLQCTTNEMMCCGTVQHYSNSKRERPKDWHLKKQHPATFPEKLTSDYIQAFTRQGMLVVDPFVGSGTTAVQCKKLDRKFVGIDVSEEYLEITKERLAFCDRLVERLIDG